MDNLFLESRRLWSTQWHWHPCLEWPR